MGVSLGSFYLGSFCLRSGSSHIGGRHPSTQTGARFLARLIEFVQCRYAARRCRQLRSLLHHLGHVALYNSAARTSPLPYKFPHSIGGKPCGLRGLLRTRTHADRIGLLNLNRLSRLNGTSACSGDSRSTAGSNAFRGTCARRGSCKAGFFKRSLHGLSSGTNHDDWLHDRHIVAFRTQYLQYRPTHPRRNLHRCLVCLYFTEHRVSVDLLALRNIPFYDNARLDRIAELGHHHHMSHKPSLPHSSYTASYTIRT